MLETRPGWLGGGEVVEVTFDPEVVPYGELLAHAKQHGCTDTVWTRTDEQQRVAAAKVGDLARRTDDEIRVQDNKYHLARTVLGFVPMTEPQACRINATLAAGEPMSEAMAWLSDGQRELLERLAKASETEPDWVPPVAVGVDMKLARQRLLEGCEAVYQRALERLKAEKDG